MHPNFQDTSARLQSENFTRQYPALVGKKRFAAAGCGAPGRHWRWGEAAQHPAGFGRKLLPGRPGMKRLMKEYGDRFVCARYRYDAERKLKIKAAEIIVG